MSPTSTSFLVISDTHGVDIHENTAHPFQLPLPKVDVLLHCGDLTQVGGHGSFRRALKMLGEVDAELKLVIAGNHDLELDGEYWRTHLDEEGGDELEEHDQAVAIMKGPLAKEAGVTYLEEGTHTFTLNNGASFSIYVSPYSPEFGDWAFGSAASEDRYHDLKDHVDIMMTHGPPKNILDSCPQGSVGCDHLLNALRRTQPLLHCFGHIHESHGAQEITWSGTVMDVKHANIDKSDRWHSVCTSNKDDKTLAINAAIQDDKGAFSNAPWLVHLPL
ncbi:Metallo-dependent phosphatase [Aureobasidium pullulans]|uniref:Metallo-dependent phosphatase n=1 Tax=Aureobasidium pullulans TaxID=5580 RepID=A0A4S9F0W5_AURPU|nr:Metallo-dependent phosphatase [Aureobasidium pullulans]TIA36348.1 Metallo-dependent phosphatase [Aureobasidium pullulans]